MLCTKLHSDDMDLGHAESDRLSAHRSWEQDDCSARLSVESRRTSIGQHDGIYLRNMRCSKYMIMIRHNRCLKGSNKDIEHVTGKGQCFSDGQTPSVTAVARISTSTEGQTAPPLTPSLLCTCQMHVHLEVIDFFFFYSEWLDIEGPLLPILSQLSTAGAERFVRTNRIVSSLACDCLTHKQAVPLLWKVIRSIYVNIYSLYVLAFELKMCITEGIFPRQKKKSSK